MINKQLLNVNKKIRIWAMEVVSIYSVDLNPAKRWHEQ